MFKDEFKGKVAVVSGAARGLGKEVAKQLATGGALVYIADILEDKAKETCKEFQDAGLKADFASVDVVDPKSCENLFKKVVKDRKQLDIGVNCAGIVLTRMFLEVTPEEVRRVVDVNLLGTNNFVTTGLKEMIAIKSEGKLVTYSSIAAEQYNDVFMHYGLTKAGVSYLTKSAAKVAAPYNINVNSVAPGIIRTPMWEKILDFLVDDPKHGSHMNRDEQFDAAIKNFIPLARGAQTEADIAYATVFLCSHFANQVTGHVLVVDGGSNL